MSQNVNDQLQLIDGDWGELYTPSLERCQVGGNPSTAMVTVPAVPGADRTHDFIQICREFYLNYLVDSMEYILSLPKGLNMSEPQKSNARAYGLDPVDTVLDSAHIVVRAVSRLYLCKFASL